MVSTTTTVPPPGGRYVHRWFEACALRHHGSIAVSNGSSRLSFEELNARANGLARFLRHNGVGPEARVALLVERSPEMVIAVLATLKAGGAFVSLDPSAPRDRLAHILRDSTPQVLLTDDGDSARELLAYSASSAIPLDLHADAPRWGRQPTADLDPDAVGLTPSHLAYVVFTSGSTGLPKGVAVEHGALSNLVAAQVHDFGLQPTSRVLQAASLSFDASVSELFMALCSGAVLTLPPPGVVPVGDALADLITRCRITHVTLTPTVLGTLPHGCDLGSVETLVVAGEAMSAATLRQAATARRVINAYGPTEATICATWHECSDRSVARPPIGRPIANVAVHILDERAALTPAGTAGEIYIGGAGVGRGYLNNPSLTAERFVPDPFSEVPGARLYATGDVACYLPDASIGFLGRNDDQVKIRGIRVELGEIESQLADAGIRPARVLVRAEGDADARLIAYYASPDPIDAGAVRERLSRTLPEYMIPSAFVRLDELPLTPNGKLDSRRLPAAGVEARARPYQSPIGQTETAVARFWAEVLRLDRVGRLDHFFEAGGHSLTAAMVIARARHVLEREAHVRDLFEHPVLCDFALALERRAPLSFARDLTGNAELDDGPSSAQKRLWVVSQSAAASKAYHVAIGPGGWARPSAMRLRGALDRNALRRALDRLLARHEVLRTSLTLSDGGELIARIVGELPFPLRELDLRGHDDAAVELERLKRECAGAPFDLARGPLIRGALVRLSDDEHVLVVTAHHIVCDGWSLSLFARELSALYAAFRDNEPDPLPPLPAQYGDYARWERRRLVPERLQAQSDYWRRALDGAPPELTLPRDRARADGKEFTGGSVEVEIDAALSRDLLRLSERYGTTLFMTLLAAWGALLGRLAGQDDVVVGAPFADRPHPEFEALIGFFVNTVALRIDLSGDPTVAELLERVKQQVLGAHQHRELPFEHVVRAVQAPRKEEHAPIFQTLFAWQNNAQAELDLQGLTISAEPLPHDTAKFDLNLSLGEAEGRIVGALEFSTVFERSTIERYVGYFHTVLRAIVADEQQRVRAIELVSEAERRRLLGELSGRAHAPGREATNTMFVHQLFAARAALNPDAVAVSDERAQLTYAQLDARANGLATQLRRMAGARELRVAICAQPSVEMVMAVLAVLKAGGAYVPLDPEYPAERLAYMLADSGSAVLIQDPRVPAELRERLSASPGVAVRVLELPLESERWREWATDATDFVDARLQPQDLAYVIYTSGSTGRPKGVAMSHGVASNLIAWQNARHEALRTIQFAPLSFDVSFQEMFSALCSGAELVLIDGGIRHDPRRLFQIICSRKIERLFVPYVALRMLADFLDGEELSDCALREVITAGEQLRITPTIVRLFERLSHCRLHNHYGPTETHVVTAFAGPAEIAEWPELPPIGRPIERALSYVLDGDQRPVPGGVVGELYIGGAVLSRGYLQQPALTAERFLPDPFSDEPGARMYRTGDLARYRFDGNLEFLGRNDHQVKIRGFRVELGEIEARLAEHPAVAAAAVALRDGRTGNRRLIAYYTRKLAVAVEELRAHLVTRLPEHMVPSAYVEVAQLPLTPSGKLDHSALPDVAEPTPTQVEAPVGDVERRLAAIWKVVLELDEVDRKASFFDSGGESLLATQMLARIRGDFGIELALDDLFDAPVLADLARVIVIKQLESLRDNGSTDLPLSKI